MLWGRCASYGIDFLPEAQSYYTTNINNISQCIDGRVYDGYVLYFNIISFYTYRYFAIFLIGGGGK